jgi:penicillin-binding protein 1C
MTGQLPRQIKLSLNPLTWVGFLLESIGRFTYRSLFKLVLLLLKLLSGLIYLIKLLLRSLNLICQVIGQVLIVLGQVLFHFCKSLKLPKKKLRFKLPKIKIPKLKVPRLKLPRIKLPKLLKPRKVRRFPRVQAALLTAMAIPFVLFYLIILKDLPKPKDLVNHQPSLSTKIYDRNHQLLFTFYKDQNRSLIKLEEIPEYFKLATLAIEDKDFYKHKGFSWTGILRSLKQIILNQQLQGGSTITQQLVKNALLTPERTLVRKLKELVLSLEVEMLFSKDQILEMYLNEVPYGGTAYGAEQASQTYFGKSIKDVNLAEAALLAGLPASPTTYSPFGSQPYLAVYRQHQVLNLMVENHLISPQEAELTKQQKIKLAPQYQNIKAPHFVMYVKDLLVQRYGLNLVEQGGLEVTTSLDLNLQEKVQDIVTNEINQLSIYNITNGAVLVTRPQTGEILAMVGSRDYFDTEHDGQVNLTTSLRQPGSAIKPVNYAAALQNGFTAATIIDDSPVTYSIPGSPPYSPVNYDSRFHGRVTVRQALANSYNVPAVKVLASYGVDKMIDMGEKLGITTWTDRSRFGLSLTLGGGEVKMVDMAVVYGTLANMGERVDLQPILKITTADGKTLMEFSCHPQTPIVLPQPVEAAATEKIACQPIPVINPNLAFILTDILADPYARAQAFGLRTYLNIPNQQVAVKTGTTNDKRDNWTIGYTRDYLVATWVGNNDNSPMSQVASGITGASPIWNKTMVELLKNSPPQHFSPPSNLVKVAICPLTGQLACEGCPSQTEYFIPGTEPTTHCSSEQILQYLENKAKQEQQERDRLLTGAAT